MPRRLSATALLVALVSLAGCTWENRPDGADGAHADSDGYFRDGVDAVDTPLGDGGVQPLGPVDDELVEPLDDANAAGATPAPTAPLSPGTDDPTTDVEEPLTPGTER